MELEGLGHCRVAVMRQQWRDFERDPAVGAGGTGVDTRERVSRAAQVVDGQREEEILPPEPGIDQVADGLVIGIAAVDGLVVDGGVRRQARHRQIGDVAIERAAVEQIPGDVVEPQALAGAVQGDVGVHVRSSLGAIRSRLRMSPMTSMVVSASGKASWSLA